MFKAREIVEPDIGNSFIHNIDPRAKIFILFAMSVMVVSVDNEKILFFLFIAPVMVYPLANLSKNKYVTAFFFLALGLWGTIFSQALFYKEWPRTIVMTIIPREFPLLGDLTSGLYVYKEGLIYGLIQGFRFSAMTASGLLLCWTTDAQKMLLGLVKLHVPYRISFMVVTALRFLPLLIAEIMTVIEAQKLKGFNPLTIKGIFSGLINTLTPVLANSVKRAGALSASIESRAFRAYPVRTYLTDLRYKPIDIGITIVFLTASILVAAIKILCGLYTRNMLYVSSMRWIYEIGSKL